MPVYNIQLEMASFMQRYVTVDYVCRMNPSTKACGSPSIVAFCEIVTFCDCSHVKSFRFPSDFHNLPEEASLMDLDA